MVFSQRFNILGNKRLFPILAKPEILADISKLCNKFKIVIFNKKLVFFDPKIIYPIIALNIIAIEFSIN